MNKLIYSRLVLCSVLCALPGITTAQEPKDQNPAVAATPAVQGLPEPPFKLKPPVEPPAKLQKVDLKTEDPETLLEYMGVAMEDENKDDAYAFLFWSNQRDPHPGAMQYLARLSMMRGKTDDGIYWLQRAALEDQYDQDEISSGAEFKPLRSDERYDQLRQFAATAKAAWEKSGYYRADVTLPKGAKPGTTLPVIVALHGLGSVPEDFGGLQNMADNLKAAVVSVSATIPSGRNSFSWAEDFEKDWTHVKKVLDSVKDKVVPEPGKCIAAGFSQGGQLAAELAAAHPDFFTGAFILSPGYMGSVRLEKAIKAGGGKLSPQMYFVVYQQGESLLTAGTAKSDVKLLTAAGARVVTHAFKGDQHSFPPGVEDHFTIWGKIILEAKPTP